jgi:fido (protein-threonine AMPylation protein)
MLFQAHQILFQDRLLAGQLRQKVMLALYSGQDCPEPEFIDRSLDNFFNWLSAESLAEIHPIEKAVIVMSRIIDIWPFEFGNITLAIVFANLFLRDAGFSPFFVLPEHTKEFDTMVRQAMRIDTQPLVNAIHRTIKREMEPIAK